MCTTDNSEVMQIMYPIEFLNMLRFSGVPNRILYLKVGTPIILLRNLNLQKGLCNGTRLVVTQISQRVLEAVIITGTRVGIFTIRRLLMILKLILLKNRVSDPQ